MVQAMNEAVEQIMQSVQGSAQSARSALQCQAWGNRCSTFCVAIWSTQCGRVGLRGPLGFLDSFPKDKAIPKDTRNPHPTDTRAPFKAPTKRCKKETRVLFWSIGRPRNLAASIGGPSLVAHLRGPDEGPCAPCKLK